MWYGYYPYTPYPAVYPGYYWPWGYGGFPAVWPYYWYGAAFWP